MSIFNKNVLLENFAGDEEILKDLIEEFLKKSDTLLANVDNAIKTNNAKDLNLHAHTLKGVVSNFYCEEIRLLAYELEKIGAENRLEVANIAFDKLKIIMPTLHSELKVLGDSL